MSNENKKLQEKWADPAYYKRMCKIRKAQANKEENLIRNSNALKLFWSKAENKARMIKDRAKSKKYRNRHPISCFKKGSVPWNKGLTKHTHPSLKSLSRKLRGQIPDYDKYRCNYISPNGKLIRMRSSWESIFAYWLDKNRIKFLYEPKHFYIGDGDWIGTTYTPDFYIPEVNLYVEVKGHASKEFWRKLVAFHKRYPNKRIIIISGREKFARMMHEVFG